MTEKLIDVTTKELMKKFGAGNHKPGSGSASALQGMISAMMLKTVIDLTNEPKRRDSYLKHLDQLLKYREEIDSFIYPTLEALFQKDSEEFDDVIKKRDNRNKENDLIKKRKLSIEAGEALIKSTETPIEIAELCLKLSKYAIEVFRHGFKSARGDSGVAINSALAGVDSCLSIIELNLTTLPFNDRIQRIVDQKDNLTSESKRVHVEKIKTQNILKKEVDQNLEYRKSVKMFADGNLATSVKSNEDIENLVKHLQNTLWLQRDLIWKGKTIESALEVLSPRMVLEKVMNYTVVGEESLGLYESDGYGFEIAGVISKKDGWVKISKAFSQETQKFTLAHELGHAILHNRMFMHRDRPLDGSAGKTRSRMEMQADKFASYFLMPSKQVEEIFFSIFGIQRFTINQDTTFYLNAKNMVALRKECVNLRGLALKIASTEYYAGRKFKSLANIFGVSITTMAIRLEELELVEF